MRVAGIERVEHLEHIAVGGHQPGREQHLAEQVEMVVGDEVLQPEQRAQRDRDHRDHGEAGEGRAEHEIGREDRRMPAGDLPAANSSDTSLCTETTSGTASAAISR